MTTEHSAIYHTRDRAGPVEKLFTYPSAPKMYRGFAIYKRHSREYHIVEEGEIVGMYAGPYGARWQVDKIVDGEVSSSRAVRLKMERGES